MDQQTLITFLALVFGTIFLLSQVIIVPAFGTERHERRRIRKRLAQIAAEGRHAPTSLLREEYLKQLSPIEKWLDTLPGTASLNRLIEQSGQMYPAYRLMLKSMILALAGGGLVWMFSHNLIAALVVLAAFGCLPYINLNRKRRKRMEAFEAQLPAALELVVRALRAGNPFNVAMSFISDEMEGPVAEEFGLTVDEIKYGRDVNRAFLYLLDRVPSMSLMAMATAIFIQRETGGNLAEVLEKISWVLRGRFRFQRRVRTLTAEGRISAWVLAMIPFLLFLALNVMNPEYMASMLTTDTGQRLLLWGVVLLMVGMFWINRLIHIKI